MSLNRLLGSGFSNVPGRIIPPGTTFAAGSVIEGLTVPTGPTGPTGATGNAYNIALKYTIRFNKSVNIVELFGHIISITKNCEYGNILFKNAMNNNKDDVSDSVIIMVFKKFSYVSLDINFERIFNITNNTFNELDARGKADKKYIADVLQKMNSTSCEFIDTVLEIVKKWGLDEESIMATMSPAAVAAMLANTNEQVSTAVDADTDADMLDRLEAFAADCDRKTSFVVGHGWEIEW